MTLDQIDSINLTDAEIVVGSVIKGAAAPLADTKGINVTLHNFAVSPMRMHDWQAESKLSGVTLALSGWKDPIAFHTGQFTLSGGKLDAQFVADLATAADIKGTLSVPDFEHPQVNFEMSSSQPGYGQVDRSGRKRAGYSLGAHAGGNGSIRAGAETGAGQDAGKSSGKEEFGNASCRGGRPTASRRVRREKRTGRARAHQH